ncbi:MAG TPA: hypothetical protein VFZ66_13650 [Herpetosiphonaceae bacterium]
MSHASVPQQRKASAVFSGETFEAFQPWIERTVGAVLLLTSFVGSVVAFNGGWEATFHRSWDLQRWTIAPLALVVGLAVQLVCTLVEWAYRRRRLSWQYLLALLVDSGATLFAFLPVLYAPIFGSLAGVVPPLLAMGVAYLVSLAVVLVAAIMPEHILVE